MGSNEGRERPTMADVSHANPRTGSTLGDLFRRGPAVTDGGKSERPDRRDSMHDVDHTGPEEPVNDVWVRGSVRTEVDR